MTDEELKDLREEVEYLGANLALVEAQVLKDNVAASEIASRAARNVEHVHEIQIRLHRVAQKLQAAVLGGK